MQINCCSLSLQASLSSVLLPTERNFSPCSPSHLIMQINTGEICYTERKLTTCLKETLKRFMISHFPPCESFVLDTQIQPDNLTSISIWSWRCINNLCGFNITLRIKIHNHLSSSCSTQGLETGKETCLESKYSYACENNNYINLLAVCS